jgi:hypothetical protein
MAILHLILLKRGEYAMKKISIFAAFIFFLAVLSVPASAANLKADDFIQSSPAMAETEAEKEARRKVQNPDSIKEETIGETRFILAQDIQDALNAFVRQKSAGCSGISFPQGIGAVATGVAVYDTFENEVATRVSKQQAYIMAYINAKIALTEWLKGAMSEARMEGGGDSTSQIDAIDNLGNVNEKWRSFIGSDISGIVRRHNVYDIFEDAENSYVYTTIVSSPALWGDIDRPAPSTISAASLQSGLDSVFTEINNGIAFPVGGKAIYVPETGEMAYVGYGSTVIRTNENSALRARLALNAEHKARRWAENSLNSIVLENETLKHHDEWDTETRRIIQQILPLSEADPTESVDEIGNERIKPQRDLFRDSEEYKFYTELVSRGKTPPGVQQKSWLDKNKGLAYAVAVYMPSFSRRVGENQSESPAKK